MYPCDMWLGRREYGVNEDQVGHGDYFDNDHDNETILGSEESSSHMEQECQD